MRAIQLDASNVVINFIEVESLGVLPNLLPAVDGVELGDTWDGTRFVSKLPVVVMPTQSDYEAAVQNMLDAKARQFGYDDIKSACTYAGDPDPTFNDQGTKLKAWRSQCWRACYNELASVHAGTAQQPTIPQLLAMLPASPL